MYLYSVSGYSSFIKGATTVQKMAVPATKLNILNFLFCKYKYYTFNCRPLKNHNQIILFTSRKLYSFVVNQLRVITNVNCNVIVLCAHRENGTVP